MKLLAITALVGALLVLLLGHAVSQDSTATSRLKPDLPLEKPVPENADDPPDEEEPPEEQAPSEEAPPEEEPPENPPPEFFEEPIETAEVIFVIDRTGSMRAPAKISIVDESGNPVNGATKIDVARIELIKSINNLSENIKFAIVCYSALLGNYTYDTNWDKSARKWANFPPAQGEPAPFGMHISGTNSLPAWPASGMVKATADNKSTAISWAQGMLALSQAKGHTSIHAGMSLALKRVIPPPPGSSSGKSATIVFLLTDGAPNVLTGICYATYIISGGVNLGNFGTWQQQCMNLTKNKILSENIYSAKIITLGMGMDNASPNTNVWNDAKKSYDFYAMEFNNKCRKFLTELAEATGGHYREVSP
jgi:hypothetical protein